VTAIGLAPHGAEMHSVEMGIPAVSVGGDMGPSLGGRVGSGMSDHVSSLGCACFSGEEEGESFNGGVPGGKRGGVRASGLSSWTVVTF
jgi:hypothetical protein